MRLEIKSDGPHSPSNSVKANGPQTGGLKEDSAGAQKERNVSTKSAGRQQRPEKPTAEDVEAEVRAGRRQRPAKPTARPSEFYYF